MIPLKKTPEPEVLSRNGATWAEEYANRISAGAKRSELPVKYRHPVIKTVVQAETCDKCAYCESKVSHSQFGDIEHIVPLSRSPELVCSWANLTLVCQRCNNAKGDYWDSESSVLNPYEDDPSEHLLFVGPYVTHSPTSDRGRITVQVIDLNRMGLIEQRTERLSRLAVLRDEYFKMKDGEPKRVVGRQLLKEFEAAREFAATARAFILTTLPDADDLFTD